MNERKSDFEQRDRQLFWFFLGGHDLEMLAILDLIDAKYEGRYSDHELSWGARASSYAEEIRQKLDEGFRPVLVELQVDLELDSRCVELVDHHGSRAGASAPTSLEQVFELIALPEEDWTRELELVAANDRGHVPALLEAGASIDEIKKIRNKDWLAQGLTESDIEQAKQALSTCKSPVKGYLRVSAKTDRSAAIADLALEVFDGPGYDTLFMDGPEEVNVFAPGKVIETLKHRFANQQESWSGGALPDRGFWGMKLPRGEGREALLQEIHNAILFPMPRHVQLAAGNPADKPASCTHFILPIAYQPKLLEGETSTQNYCYRKLEWMVSGDQAAELWRERRRYFTEETAEVLYRHAAWFELGNNLEDKTGSIRSGKPGAPLGTFQFRAVTTERTLEISMSAPRLILFNWELAKEAGKNASGRETESANPLLNGLLVVELYFDTEVRYSELLEVNETFRTILPPFNDYYKWDIAPRYENPSRTLHALLTKLGIAPGQNREELVTWKKWVSLLDVPIHDGERCWRLAPKSWLHEDAAAAMNQDRWVEEPHVFKCSNTKAFVWTAALPESPSHFQELSQETEDKRHLEGDWIKLLNIDKASHRLTSHHELMQASAFEKDWASNPSTTYTRWVSYGTLYGFTDHSGAMVASPIEEPPLWQHFRLLYRDQALFLLYLRATLFRFSHLISQITQKRLKFDEESRHGAREMARFRTGFDHLRRRFVEFANLYQFPLLSTEQQSLEMYSAQRETLEIDSLYREVKTQIDNAHDQVILKTQAKSLELTTQIAILGIPLLLAGLIASLFSINPSIILDPLMEWFGREPDLEYGANYMLVVWLVILLVVLIPMRVFENRIFKAEKRPRHRPRSFDGRSTVSAFRQMIEMIRAHVRAFEDNEFDSGRVEREHPNKER